MGIASRSAAVFNISKSGYNIPAWGLYGSAEHYYNGGMTGLIHYATRLTFTTDALGGTSLSFTVAGVSTRVWDNFYAAWMSTNASGRSVSVAEMAPWYYVSASAAYDPSAARSRAAVSGTAYSGSVSMRLSPNSTYYLYLIRPTAGAASGTLTVTVSGSWGAPASVAAADGFFGEALPITLSGGSAGAAYTVAVSCAGRAETLQSQGSLTLLSWTPDLETYAALLPDADSAAAVITCTTLYSGTAVGSASKSVTLRFRPGSLPPETDPGWFSLTPVSEGAAALMSGYIAHFSRAEAAFDETKVRCLHGASVASFSLSLDGETVAAAPYRSPILRGESALTLTVTDSRGQSASETVSLTPLPYAAPALSAPALFRCDADGDADEAGLCYAARSGVTFSDLGGQNTLTLSAAHRFPGGSWSAETALTPGQTAVIPGLSADRSYELRITAVDDLGGTARWLRRIPSQKWAMKFRPDGEGLAFGMAPEQANCLQIPEDWSFRRGSRPQPVETYAVGDLYLTTRAGDPAELLGYGVWARIEDCFLLAAGATYAAGSTGGEAAHTLTVDEMPSHRHTTPTALSANFGPTAPMVPWVNKSQSYGDYNTTNPVGGGQAHNNLPPYLAVYVWKRTA